MRRGQTVVDCVQVFLPPLLREPGAGGVYHGKQTMLAGHTGRVARGLRSRK